MRNIKYIVIHCTATHQNVKVIEIQNYWRHILKWKSPGYHYLIEKDGTVHMLLHEDKIANGVAGYNQFSIHISYIGGIDKRGFPVDNRSNAQKAKMLDLIKAMLKKYPTAKVYGHRDFPGVTKACPSFNVREWLKLYGNLMF